MGPSSLADRRKFSRKDYSPGIEVDRGARKAGRDGWEDPLQKSLEAQTEAKSVITDKKN